MKKDNYLKVKILESGEIVQTLPKYKYKKVISKNGNEYLRAINTPSWNDVSKEEKLKIFEKQRKRLNDNEVIFMKSRFDRIANQEKHSKSKYDNKIYKCYFSFEEFLNLWENHKIKYGGVFCAISGDPMTLIGLNDKKRKFQRNWANVSVDRIDSNKPYTLQNIIFVKWEINRSKQDFSIEHMKKYLSIYEDRFVKLKPLN
jgi:hypothetical protein